MNNHMPAISEDKAELLKNFPFIAELRIKLEISYKMEMQKLQFSKLKSVTIVVVTYPSVCRP